MLIHLRGFNRYFVISKINLVPFPMLPNRSNNSLFTRTLLFKHFMTFVCYHSDLLFSVLVIQSVSYLDQHLPILIWASFSKKWASPFLNFSLITHSFSKWADVLILTKKHSRIRERQPLFSGDFKAQIKGTGHTLLPSIDSPSFV